MLRLCDKLVKVPLRPLASASSIQHFGRKQEVETLFRTLSHSDSGGIRVTSPEFDRSLVLSGDS
jgi:hypothetical protein